ncbi:MAG TPA: rhodanese-like domain-containing protein [Steroidobacteraceae bacterium]|jgi:rhodanese-related sulfurtransferase|nr:rhodanese-like domain-containing protein [Steroidobacteraceae bacterium]
MERLIEYVTHHPLLVGAAALALVLVVTTESRLRATAFAAISAQDLIRLMNQGALVLDIRKPDEFAAGHVNGAKHLPSDQILTAGENFKRFKDKPVVVYCDSGSLAASAVRQLHEQGFTKAFTLRGGFAGWRAENLPVAKAA